MLFMVIERFKDARAVYRRMRERGRMLPEGLKYVESWTEANYSVAFS
jgi:tRNA splicing endonuclease